MASCWNASRISIAARACQTLAAGGAFAETSRLREVFGVVWARRVELSQRRAQRIKPRGVGKFVVLDGAPDLRRYRGELVVRKVNCRHGPDIIGRYLSSKEKGDMPRGGAFHRVARRECSLGPCIPAYAMRPIMASRILLTVDVSVRTVTGICGSQGVLPRRQPIENRTR